MGDGVELVWSLGAADPNAPATVLRREMLDPKIIKQEHSWRTIVVGVPALDRARTLTLTAGSGPRGDPSYDRIIVTCGEDATGDNAGSPERGKD